MLAETAGSLAKKLRGDSLEDFGRWLKQEADLVRDGMVAGHERWLDRIGLPDEQDAHVLCAAIECGATTIVTENLRDFPAEALDPFGIAAVGADEFLLTCISTNPVVADLVVAGHPRPVRLLERLDAALPRTARMLRELVG